MVAVEAVLLRRRHHGGRDTAADGDGLWPVLAVVLADGISHAVDPSVRRLLELIDNGHRRGLVTVLPGMSQWLVTPDQNGLLRLCVRSGAPAGIELDIVLPLRPLESILGTLACQPTLALTTSRYADQLTSGASVWDTLRGLVLVRCASVNLATMVSRQQRQDGRPAPW